MAGPGSDPPRAGVIDTDQFPDLDAIPRTEWIPILVRCRDIAEHRTIQVLDDLLTHALQLRSLLPDQQEGLKDYLKAKVLDGRGLLMIDGLDEIRDTQVRTNFARRIQEIVLQNPELPMLITCRKVGYMEMRSRLGVQFRHADIADLKKDDKEKFARNWCRASVPEIDRDSQTSELIAAIDSNEDIKKITNNALLLTILAIVIRKLHRLPHRRAELYRYFMQVLFDFNPTVWDRIDSREAFDQLGYLAYAMESDGRSRVDEDRMLSYLMELRATYQTPAINKHSPQDFVLQIARQTSIIVQKGFERIGALEVPVYEFKHDTFMHYFAGLALLSNIYPNSKRDSALGQRIMPVFEHPEVVERQDPDRTEWTVKENWREILRLCVGTAGLNDAENALNCMLDLTVGSVASANTVLRSRMGAVMAALCLVDEPNVRLMTGQQVVEHLLETITDDDAVVEEGDPEKRYTSLAEAVLALSKSPEWRQFLDDALLMALETYPHYRVWIYGSLYVMSHEEYFLTDDSITSNRVEVLQDLRSDDTVSVIRACLRLVNVLYQDSILASIDVDADLSVALFQALDRSHAEKLVAIWALAWLWDRYYLKSLERTLGSRAFKSFIRSSAP